MIPARMSLALVGLLLVLRAVMAGLLPLSADEAYYWLWSNHLAAGYFDHPPMIAWLIRAGTLMLDDTPLGVRLMGVVLSLPASWFVWQAAKLITGETGRAGLAVLFFNLTVMISVELLAATPDMPSVVASAAFLYCLAQVQATQRGNWWLAAGAAAGLGLLAKYSTLFLGAGALLWVLLDARQRRWLSTPWPYLGGALAGAIFAPHLIWQSQHHWQTFLFQFGRVGASHFTPRYLGEFLAAQMGMATPFIFALMIAGLSRGMRRDSPLFLPAVLAWTGLGYFLAHALHDRVQGNWPCFLFPALCVLAAAAYSQDGWQRWISWAAAPLAAVLLLAIYVQALFQPIPFQKDPVARILGRHFIPVGDFVAAMVRARLADAILTTDYETTAWLRWEHPDLKVIQLNEPQRYLEAPPAPVALMSGRLIYLAELRRDQHPMVQKDFAYLGFPTQLQTPSSRYMLYPVGRPKTAQPIGKMP